MAQALKAQARRGSLSLAGGADHQDGRKDALLGKPRARHDPRPQAVGPWFYSEANVVSITVSAGQLASLHS